MQKKKLCSALLKIEKTVVLTLFFIHQHMPIYLALRALDIGPGDEVITVCNSWISTSEVIGQVGANVKFIDIELDNFNIDVNSSWLIGDNIRDIEAAIAAGVKPILLNEDNKMDLSDI